MKSNNKFSYDNKLNKKRFYFVNQQSNDKNPIYIQIKIKKYENKLNLMIQHIIQLYKMKKKIKFLLL